LKPEAQAKEKKSAFEVPSLSLQAPSTTEPYSVAWAFQAQAKPTRSFSASSRPETLAMPNDAKLGLILGVALVIAVAVVFFRKEAGPGGPPTNDWASAKARETGSLTPSSRPYRSVPAKTATLASGTGVRRHVVQEGDTLSSLAEHYFGDKNKASEIRRENQEAFSNSDRPVPGTVLLIPDLGVRQN
jgi:nucleoid-associated protein YgaU